MSKNGHFAEYELPAAGSAPFGITEGPHEAIWSTEMNGGNQIGRITIDGAITEYEIPSKNAEPHGIAICPGGDIWFAEECNQIGRLTMFAS